jgi:hypothetical protein
MAPPVPDLLRCSPWSVARLFDRVVVDMFTLELSFTARHLVVAKFASNTRHSHGRVLDMDAPLLQSPLPVTRRQRLIYGQGLS